MKKQLVAVIIIFMLALNIYATSPELTVSIPEKAALVDGQYHIMVSISDNPGFASVQLELFYNSSVMDCIKVIPGDAVKGMLTDTNPDAGGAQKSAILSVAGISDTNANGIIATFVFEKITGGDPEFEFKLVEMRTSDGREVDCTVEINNNYGYSPDDPIVIPPTNDQEQNDAPVVIPLPENPENNTKPIVIPLPNGSGTNEEPTVIPLPEDTVNDVGESDTEEQPPATAEPPKTFSDVGELHWAKDYIAEAVKLGIVSGYTDGRFLPDKEMTRAEFTTLLWNMENKPKPSKAAPFSDVEDGDWFYDPVSWAYENGYINGISATEFDPNGTITREQAMTILYRYAKCPSAQDAITAFKDSSDVSDYAVDAFNWAIEKAIIAGMDGNRLAPKANATRAQLSTIIVRYIKNID